MDFIDVNAMLGHWPYKELYIWDVEGLKREMSRLGIVRSYVMDIRAWLSDLRDGNAATAEAARGHDCLTPTMVLTPLLKQEFGGAERLREVLRQNRIGAVRLFPVDHSFTLNLWNVGELFELLSDMRMPVMIDRMEDTGGFDDYEAIYALCKAFPRVPVVLLTPGYRSGRILYKLWESCPNFYVDTSLFIANRAIEDVVKHFGSQNILFGTRCPYLEPGTCVGRVLYADIDDADRQNIASGNMRRLDSQIDYLS